MKIPNEYLDAELPPQTAEAWDYCMGTEHDTVALAHRVRDFLAERDTELQNVQNQLAYAKHLILNKRSLLMDIRYDRDSLLAALQMLIAYKGLPCGPDNRDLWAEARKTAAEVAKNL